MNEEQLVLAKIAARGLLLLQDRKVESAVELLAGRPVQGSWWSHPDAHRIYEILERVGVDSDVLIAKLVAGKVTFIHRRLWPAVLSVVTARQPWQTDGLSRAGQELLSSVDSGSVVEATGVSAKEIEGRLLARGTEVHTAAGKHATRLESWSLWSRDVGCESLRSADEGKRLLEDVVVSVGGLPAMLPWRAGRQRRPRRAPAPR